MIASQNQSLERQEYCLKKYKRPIEISKECTADVWAEKYEKEPATFL
jgi:hypothetical protein